MTNQPEDEFVVDFSGREVTTDDKSVRDLEEQNKFLRDKLFEVLQRQDKLESDMSKLKRVVEQKDKTIQILQSQAKHLSKTVETLEKETNQTEAEIRDELTSLKERLAVQFVENETGDTGDESSTKLQKSAALSNTCKLEQLSYLDETVRDEEFSKPLSRAVFIWENWGELAEQTINGGSVIDSGDIRKLLIAKEGQKIDYNLVYRAMQTFDEKTNSDYLYKKDQTGRKLVKTGTRQKSPVNEHR